MLSLINFYNSYHCSRTFIQILKKLWGLPSTDKNIRGKNIVRTGGGDNPPTPPPPYHPSCTFCYFAWILSSFIYPPSSPSLRPLNFFACNSQFWLNLLSSFLFFSFLFFSFLFFSFLFFSFLFFSFLFFSFLFFSFCPTLITGHQYFLYELGSIHIFLKNLNKSENWAEYFKN